MSLYCKFVEAFTSYRFVRLSYKLNCITDKYKILSNVSVYFIVYVIKGRWKFII